jgi:hypothetical protein
VFLRFAQWGLLYVALPLPFSVEVPTCVFLGEVFFREAGCIDSEHGVFGAATKRIMLRKQLIRWELGVDGFGVGLGLGA